jgi:MarR family transcriptional regulator, organic hydroperoxide resistance regulator
MTIDAGNAGRMDNEPSALQLEMRQRTPFRSTAQEAVISMLRTADTVRRRLAHVIEPHGITLQQYNVLRILRGARPDPMPTLEIGERLIERTPGITRLLDRLEEKGLVRRERCATDRRLVHAWITESGLELLATLETPVDQADEAAVAALTPDERIQLLRLLESVRADPGSDPPRATPSLTGPST